MATLKDLIKTETLKVGATACAPSGSVVDLAGILRDGNTEYVLPESGYVSLCAPSPINTWAGLSCNEIASQARSDAADSWVTHHIYGKKGDVVKITVDRVSRIGWVRFVKAIGGGYKRYLKALACNRFGGALWLRLKTTSETLPRGLRGSCLRRQAVSQSPLLGAEVNNLLRLVTDGSACGEETPQITPSVTAACGTTKRFRMLRHGLPLSQRHSYRSSSLFEKVKRSTVHGTNLLFSGNQKGFSFGVCVASNNARMEVAA